MAPKLTMTLCAVLLMTLAACAGLTSTAGPEKRDVVRVLCSKNERGQYLFGPVPFDRLADTPGTIASIKAQNAAWDAATEEGKLCGGWGITSWVGSK